MARKRIRPKPTAERPPAPSSSPISRPREPEHTATFWRNTYEAERLLRESLSRRLRAAQEENDRLRAQLEGHTKPATRRLNRRVSRSVNLV